MDKSLFDSLLQENKVRLFEALRAKGIAVLTVEYRGAGDSGEGFDMYTEPSKKSLKTGELVSVRYVKYDYVARAKKEVTESVSLEEALTIVCDAMIEEYHSGFEINEGGGGTIIFDADDSSISWDHYDNIVTEEHTAHTF